MLRDHRRTARIVAFVGLTYVLSWSWWIALALSGTTVDEGQGWPTHLIGLTAPGLAAVVVTGLTEGRAGLSDLGSRVSRWRVGWRWYGLVAATVVLAAVPLVAKSGVGTGDLVRYSGAPAVGLAVVPYVVVVNGFGEEIGWRGFLADRLLEVMSQGRAALIVWPCWALWHLPLFWVVEGFRDFGVFGTVGWVIGIGFGSVLLTWMYASSGRSILIVALWHSAYNFAAATDASRGFAAVVATTAVIVVSVTILRRASTWTPPCGTELGDCR